MQKYKANVQGTNGDAINEVSVTVRLADTGALATIYSDADGSALSNPFTNKTNGVIEFWAANNRYSVELSGGASGSDSQVVLFDPADASILERTILTSVATYPATAGDHVMVDVGSNAVTVTLPASPKVGNSIRVSHGAGDLQNSGITIQSAADDINSEDQDIELGSNGASVLLTFVGEDIGWRTFMDTGPTLYAYKSADEIKTSDSTLADDSDLSVAMELNAQYSFEAFVRFPEVHQTPDVKLSLAVPAGASADFMLQAVQSDAVQLSSAKSAGDVVVVSSVSNTDEVHLRIVGTVKTGATAGSAVIQWAQNTSDANNVALGQGSWVKLIKMDI